MSEAVSIYTWGTTPRSPGAIDAGSWTQYIPFSTAPTGAQSKIVIEEVIPGVGSAHLEIWDLTNQFSFAYWAPIWIIDNASGQNMFTGMIQKVKMTPVATYRLWTIDCVDVNALCDTQLVGCPDGSTWEITNTSTGTVATQPGYTGNIKGLFSAFWLYGLRIDTTTYVDSTLLQSDTFDRVTLRRAADQLASLGGPLITWWIDQGTGYVPNDIGGTTCYLHLTSLANVTNIGVAGSGTLLNEYGWSNGGPLTLLFPYGEPNVVPGGGMYAAPYAITDLDPDYVNSWDAETVSLEADYSAFRFSLYVRGATDYTYNSGAVKTGGSGWVGYTGNGGSSYLSDFYDAPDADTHASRNGFGMAALHAMAVPIMRGTAELILDPAKGSGVKLFHAGQNLVLTSNPMGIYAGNFFVMRATTYLLSGDNKRRVSLDWGTAAKLNVAQRRNVQKSARATPAKGASVHMPSAAASSVTAGQSVVVSTQLTNVSGAPWAIAGKTVLWSCKVVNDTGTDITATTHFTLTPTSSITDASGKASTTLATDGTVTEASYLVSATTPD